MKQKRKETKHISKKISMKPKDSKRGKEGQKKKPTRRMKTNDKIVIIVIFYH